jgi:hypothetical protein
MARRVLLQAALFVFFPAAAGTGIVAADLGLRRLDRRRSLTHRTGVEPCAVDALELRLLWKRVFRIPFSVVRREIDEGRVRTDAGFVRVDHQPGPVPAAGVRFGDVGLASRLQVRAVQVGVVARHMGGEARTHQLLGGRGRPLLRQDRIAALGKRLPAAAGAGLFAAGRREFGRRSSHASSPMRVPFAAAYWDT